MPTPSPKMGLAVPSQTDPFSTADVAANWTKLDAAPGAHICTSTTRPSWGAGQAGRKIYENNTGLEYVWTGTAFERPVGSAEPPTGSVTAWASVSTTPPAGWLFCDGTTKVRAAHPALFSVIGITYGPGDGSTTFHLPSMMDKFILGAIPGSSTKGVGKSGGNYSVTLDSSHMPSHVHSIAHNHTMAHNHTATTSGEGSHAHNTEVGHVETAGAHDWGYADGGGRTFNVDGIQSSDLQGYHNHSVIVSGSSAASTGSASPNTSGAAGLGAAFTVTPPFMAMAYIIKT